MTETRGRGRPTTGTPIQVRLPEQTIEDLDRIAAQEGIGRPAVIRALLEYAIEQLDDPMANVLGLSRKLAANQHWLLTIGGSTTHHVGIKGVVDAIKAHDAANGSEWQMLSSSDISSYVSDDGHWTQDIGGVTVTACGEENLSNCAEVEAG